jgi:hypothetical protein
MKNEVDENWVFVFKTTDENLCERAKLILKKEKIESVIMNKKDSNFLIGEVELFVKMEDMGNAHIILKGTIIE